MAAAADIERNAKVASHGGLRALCDALVGLERNEFFQQFHDQFETVKESFPDEPGYNILINAKAGWEGRADEARLLGVEIITITK
jgi:hypothetical protein